MLALVRNCLQQSRACAGSKHRLMSWGGLCFALLLFLSLRSFAAGQDSPKKNVLIITEVGLSHIMSALQVLRIIEGVEKPGRQVEFYSEHLDLLTMPAEPSACFERRGV